MPGQKLCDLRPDCRGAIVKEPKIPLAAAVLAFVLGGPGFFYLGWRRGAKATLAWLLVASIITTTQLREGGANRFQPEVIYLFLLQAASAWMAYRSCKRSNAEAAKATDSVDTGATRTDGVTRRMDRNLQPMAEPGCSKKLKNIGVLVIAGSGLALFGALSLFRLPPMGEMGRFEHEIFGPLVLCMAPWGLATGIGLLRAWRWARISMLVFSSLLAVSGALGVVGFLFMPNGNVSGWTLFLITAGATLFCLIPVAIGVWWSIYFTRNNVKAHFQTSRKAPLASA